MKKFRNILHFLILTAIAVGMMVLLNQFWQQQKIKKETIKGLREQVSIQQQENQKLIERNHSKIQEIQALQSPDAFLVYEEKARQEYGMIGKNETFFMLRDSDIAHIPDIENLESSFEQYSNSIYHDIVVLPTETAFEIGDLGQDSAEKTPPLLQLESLQEADEK